MATYKDSIGLEEDHLFKSIEITQHVSLPPSYLGKFPKGITEVLNMKLLKFLPDYKGFVLSYSKPAVLQRAASIVNESPNLHFDVQVQLYLFTPVIGACLCGTVNYISEDHVGCLVYDCFNASVKGLPHSIAKGDSIRFRVVSIDTVSGVVCIHGEEVSTLTNGVEDICADLGDEENLYISNGNSVDFHLQKKHTKKKTRKHARCSDSDGSTAEEELHRSKKRKKNRSSDAFEDTKKEVDLDAELQVVSESLKKKHKSHKKSRSKNNHH